ncbi:SDR family NAD(P)-dependent oxidoreductase [Marinobacterium sp. xm-m-312]|uniref:SDR family NAD(P)-dependent oxidoreductase n=1 Tax=unclassified Marinobacterium TaxID=2644139 RepID=UPI0019EE33B9|nr:putative oxidoreductase [Marinobacterium sp. xm-d-543]NRQ23070.1 putative oxidoreductase [Marinobacterium sp. xm-m-312]
MASRIWIIGGSTGIGAALAKAYLDEGYQVLISARNEERLVTLAESIGCQSMPLDVTDRDSCIKAWADICQECMPDKVIISSGTHQEMPATEFNAENCESLMQVNYFGVVYLLEAILPTYLKSGGQIGVISSLAGYRGLPYASSYGASKAALINLCESLRVELEDSKVDIRLINPGFVKTPLTDKNQFQMPALISPEQAAAEIVKGLKGRSFEIRFPKLFAATLALLRHLPYKLYFPLVKRVTKR